MNQLLKILTKKDSDCRPIPFWSWNDKLEPEELKRQIHWMKKQGIGGFFMHARGGLGTPYLSDEWMKCIETCAEEAKKIGMNAWLYDENGWPSGFAGGKLLTAQENRDMYIIKEVGPFDAEADVSYLIEGECLIRVQEEKPECQCLNLYLKYSVSSVDILNPKVVDQFIDATHEKYKQFLGSEFSKKIKGFFTDEPQYYRWATPYTPMLKDYFQEHYNEDVLENLGLLFVEKQGYRRFRYQYWSAMQELMLCNYSKRIYEWCEQNDVCLTGHYVEEVSMGYQIMCCGGVMPFYEYMHLPGIDWLGNITDNELAPRQLGSAARQLGKKYVLTETFGGCGWDITPRELRRIAGFQFANGVNMVCHHLFPYSEHGQRKRDYPAHFNTLNPWVEEYFGEFNDYLTKIGNILANSEEIVNIAMLHPIRSAYFDYKREEESNGFGIRELDESLKKACRLFSSRGMAYHFLDETLLEKHGFVEKKQIGCGKCRYTYLVLPKLYTMGKYTEQLVRQFVEQGGKILLLDEKPFYLEGETYAYDYLVSNCTLDEIMRTQPFVMEESQTELYCTYRVVGRRPILYVQNASSHKAYTQTFRFAEDYKSFTSLNPLTYEMEKETMTVTVPPSGSVLLLPTKEMMSSAKMPRTYELRFRQVCPRFETNYLIVDAVRYSKDGTTYSNSILCNQLFERLLQERYQGKLWIRYEFRLKSIPKKLELITERSEMQSASINGQELGVLQTCMEERSFGKTDISNKVRQGMNVYEVVLDWKQNEDVYYALFGNDVTEGLRNCIAYDSELEPIYLAGQFGVYSDAEMIDRDSETICATDFYIGDIPQSVTELVTDGFPFFAGKITMSQDIELTNSNVLLEIPGRYMCATVKINGQSAGTMLFTDNINISSLAKVGLNHIEVEFIIGNRNRFGPFHCTWPEDWISPGVFGICDLTYTEGKPGYKLYKFYGGQV